jgi:hypothetical protein
MVRAARPVPYGGEIREPQRIMDAKPCSATVSKFLAGAECRRESVHHQTATFRNSRFKQSARWSRRWPGLYFAATASDQRLDLDGDSFAKKTKRRTRGLNPDPLRARETATALLAPTASSRLGRGDGRWSGVHEDKLGRSLGLDNYLTLAGDCDAIALLDTTAVDGNHTVSRGEVGVTPWGQIGAGGMAAGLQPRPPALGAWGRPPG